MRDARRFAAGGVTQLTKVAVLPLSNLPLVAKQLFELILQLGLVLLRLRKESQPLAQNYSCHARTGLRSACGAAPVVPILRGCRAAPFRVWFRPLHS